MNSSLLLFIQATLWGQPTSSHSPFSSVLSDVNVEFELLEIMLHHVHLSLLLSCSVSFSVNYCFHDLFCAVVFFSLFHSTILS